MIAILIKVLSMTGLSEAAAKRFAPVVLIGLAALALWGYGRHQFGEGREAQRLAQETAINDELVKRQAAFLDALSVSQSNYEKTLEAFSAIRTAAPEIIREIRDASPTDCSGVLISDDEFMRLRRAFAVRPARNAAAWREAG